MLSMMDGESPFPPSNYVKDQGFYPAPRDKFPGLTPVTHTGATNADAQKVRRGRLTYLSRLVG
jgi:hypothetical protein